MESKDRTVQTDETELRAERVKGVHAIEIANGDASVRFVSDCEYRRVMTARGYDPESDFREFMDAEDFTDAIRVKLDGVDGWLCST